MPNDKDFPSDGQILKCSLYSASTSRHLDTHPLLEESEDFKRLLNYKESYNMRRLGDFDAKTKYVGLWMQETGENVRTALKKCKMGPRGRSCG